MYTVAIFVLVAVAACGVVAEPTGLRALDDLPLRGRVQRDVGCPGCQGFSQNVGCPDCVDSSGRLGCPNCLGCPDCPPESSGRMGCPNCLAESGETRSKKEVDCPDCPPESSGRFGCPDCPPESDFVHVGCPNCLGSSGSCPGGDCGGSFDRKRRDVELSESEAVDPILLLKALPEHE